MTLGGLVVLSSSSSGSSSRHVEPTRVIGHPDLASGTSVQRGQTLYVSVAEAVYRQRQGADVELHLTPTEEDNEALADFRARARQRWESDRLPDGWTRPLPPPTPKDEAPRARGVDDLPDELRALAERIRSSSTHRAERPRDGAAGRFPTSS